MEELLDLQKKQEVPPPPSATTPGEDEDAVEEGAPRTRMHAFTRERHPRPLAAVHTMLLYFSPSERLLLYLLTACLCVSTLVLVVTLSTHVTTTIPSRGGAISEGTVGTPRFINPLLAVSQTDQDLTMLVYSGLMRVGSGGDMMSDIAERYEVNEDGTQYTFHIRRDATFHDGKPVTAEDVVFTVALAQNPDIKSPRRSDWEGVTVATVDEHTVTFTLPHAYAPFLENTHLGIVPKHLWENIPADEFPFHVLNTKPVGSGPYMIGDIAANDAGTPLSYALTAFEQFTLGSPYIRTIVFHFYSNEDALLTAFRARTVDSFAGISPDHLPLSERIDVRVVRAPSTRLFAVFLNQNHASVFADAAVRDALDSGIDRGEIIKTVLSGYGTHTFGPIPPGLLPRTPEETDAESEVPASSASDKARGLLEKGGWKLIEPTSTSSPGETAHWKKKASTLSFALATADTPELVATANAVADQWRTVGIDVSVQIYPLTEFNTTVLRPRSYDAVLFGEVVGRSLDLFAFWHSSQRNDPGLNLALYANSKADKLLASARAELNRNTRDKSYRAFAEIVADDNPAVFLYSPDFVYVVPTAVQNLSLSALTTPSERFLNVHEWYTDTERVWDVFAK